MQQNFDKIYSVITKIEDRKRKQAEELAGSLGPHASCEAAQLSSGGAQQGAGAIDKTQLTSLATKLIGQNGLSSNNSFQDLESILRSGWHKNPRPMPPGGGN